MKRKAFRIYFYGMKFIIGLLVYFDARVYMKLYTWLLRQTGMEINGEPRFIAKSAWLDDFDRIRINERLVVSKNVYFLTHDYSYTTALIANNERPHTDIGLIRSIRIGRNVFIGMNSIILPGTEIGDNVIIGAGSVVRGKIPDNAVVAGNPGIVIGDIREYLKKVKSRKDHELIIDRK